LEINPRVQRVQVEQDKIEYLECKFSDVKHEIGLKVRLNTQFMLKRGSVKYLGFLIKENREIDKDVTHRIGAGWMK